MEIFAGRTIIIATKHQKERVIAPLLEESVGLHCMVPGDLDTDSLGTFSGEVNRPGSPIETLRRKCLLAMEIFQGDLVLASEGSFGPHPFLPFIPADEEWLMLMDVRNNLELVVKELSSETNFSAKTVRSYQELLEFANEVQFPSHGLILKAAENDFVNMEKGIQSYDELDVSFQKIFPIHSSVYVMTDMRAMHNPSRMKVIESAVQKLITKMNSRCPQCKLPGFDVVNIIPGLPCEVCGAPTRSSLKYQLQCTACHYSEEQFYPKGKKVENPMYCDYCNP